nr:MAG TPA_asm: hypothetical protein [Caudoviricetes sp.]
MDSYFGMLLAICSTLSYTVNTGHWHVRVL